MHIYSFCLLIPCLIADPVTAPEWESQGNRLLEKRQFKEAAAAFRQVVKLEPTSAAAQDALGSAEFFAGNFAASVAAFDRAVALDPLRANGHWRRGISLYYAGKFEAGKKQFESYEAVDTNDVENAVWHFLCAARADSIESARKSILKIGKDGRIPMMKVYDLFQGKCTPADVLAAANAGTVPASKRKQQLFYAHLYLGIYAEIQGDKKKAIEHLGLAADRYRIAHYMGEVARVHQDLLARPAK